MIYKLPGDKSDAREHLYQETKKQLLKLIFQGNNQDNVNKTHRSQEAGSKHKISAAIFSHFPPGRPGVLLLSSAHIGPR